MATSRIAARVAPWMIQRARTPWGQLLYQTSQNHTHACFAQPHPILELDQAQRHLDSRGKILLQMPPQLPSGFDRHAVDPITIPIVLTELGDRHAECLGIGYFKLIACNPGESIENTGFGPQTKDGPALHGGHRSGGLPGREYVVSNGEWAGSGIRWGPRPPAHGGPTTPPPEGPPWRGPSR